MATDPEAIPREALPRQSGAARAWRVLRAARPARTGPGMDRAAAWPASAGSGPSGRALILAVATIFALVVTLVGATLRYDRERRVQNAHDQAATLARVLEEQTASVLWAADVSLLGIAETLRRQPGLAAHDPAFEDSLRRVRNQVPAIRALFVIGADGFITQDTDRHTPHRNLADRDYFRAHLEGPDRGMFVGQPLVSRSVDTWFVGLSRRVETPAGAFAGVAAAAVDARYFESFYEDLGLRSGDVITLATRDGVLVARQPRADDRVGQPLVGAEGQNLLLDALARGRGGTFEKPSEIDGRPRIFGYRAIEGRPLVVLVGLPQDRVLASWYQGVAVATAATLAVMAFGIFVVWLAMRHSRREAAARQRLDEAATLEALGRLTGGVAHDFNNLLQALVSALRLLRSGPADGARAQRIIEHGLAAADRGRRQVAELLRIARWRDTRPREVDVNALLGEMTGAAAWRCLARRAGGARPGGGSAPLPRGSGPARRGDPEPRRERARGAAAGPRRAGRDPDRHGELPRADRVERRQAPRPRAVHPSQRAGRWRRHAAGSAPPRAGAVLHQQGRERRGHRAAADPCLRPGARRRHADRERARRGHQGEPLPSARVRGGGWPAPAQGTPRRG